MQRYRNNDRRNLCKKYPAAAQKGAAQGSIIRWGDSWVGLHRVSHEMQRMGRHSRLQGEVQKNQCLPWEKWPWTGLTHPHSCTFSSGMFECWVLTTKRHKTKSLSQNTQYGYWERDSKSLWHSHGLGRHLRQEGGLPRAISGQTCRLLMPFLDHWVLLWEEYETQWILLEESVPNAEEVK